MQQQLKNNQVLSTFRNGLIAESKKFIEFATRNASFDGPQFGVNTTLAGVVDSRITKFMVKSKDGTPIERKSLKLISYQLCLKDKHQTNNVGKASPFVTVNFAKRDAIESVVNLAPGTIISMQVQLSTYWIESTKSNEGGYYTVSVNCFHPVTVIGTISPYIDRETRNEGFKKSQGFSKKTGYTAETTLDLDDLKDTVDGDIEF